jgi:HTH-type transcriptional regulator/antitoxin HigA
MQPKSKKMNIKPIKTEQDYQDALKRLEIIFDAAPNTIEGDELEILGVLIDNYEKIYFPIDLPDPIEAIKFRMEQLNYSNNDLAQVIGLKSRVSEILNKKRKLSINMIRKIHDIMNIPTDVLVQEY